MPKEDMDEHFHVLSLSRNDILITCGDYLLNRAKFAHLYPEAKTLVENMSDDDMVDFIEGLCSIEDIFKNFYDTVGEEVKFDLEEKKHKEK